MKRKIDFEVIDSGSVCMLQPMTKSAEKWIDENIGSGNGYQPYYPHYVVIEPRYLADIREGILADNLVIES